MFGLCWKTIIILIGFIITRIVQFSIATYLTNRSGGRDLSQFYQMIGVSDQTMGFFGGLWFYLIAPVIFIVLTQVLCNYNNIGAWISFAVSIGYLIFTAITHIRILMKFA